MSPHGNDMSGTASLLVLRNPAHHAKKKNPAANIGANQPARKRRCGQRELPKLGRSIAAYAVAVARLASAAICSASKTEGPGRENARNTQNRGISKIAASQESSTIQLRRMSRSTVAAIVHVSVEKRPSCGVR